MISDMACCVLCECCMYYAVLWLCCAVRVVLWRWCRDFAVLPECFAVLRAVRVVCCVVEAVLRECFAHVRVLCTMHM